MDTNLVIDCDAAPFIPKGWVVEKHQKGGKFEWDVAKVQLFLCEKQKSDDVFIDGYGVCRELEDKHKHVFNANVLDYLLAHQDLIPEEWRGLDKAIYFWGTTYCCSDGVVVRSLFWSSCRGWESGGRQLARGFNKNPFCAKGFAAVRTS